ncbi:MAG TPA: hypothetical protein VMP67_05090 [Candidatus Limnocylindria bacterium]|nr:hypothetical protein [Candidatus Limnocylindria bacterium]
MHAFETSGFAEFDRLAELFRRTWGLLDVLSATGSLPSGGSDLLATETLPHVEDMEEGFRIRLRASAAELSELRGFVLHAGIGQAEARDFAEQRAALIEAMHELGQPSGQREILPAPARRLAAIEHARLVFALLPATPSADVHYPVGLRSYADIPAPRTATELSARIEELERSLWAIAIGRPPRLSDGAYRRTYGFFDTAARMGSTGLLPS